MLYLIYLFIDGTFKSFPISYSQVLNIIGVIKKENISIPILSVIMKYKYEISYINMFANLKLMLTEYSIDVDFSKIYMMSDYEKSLRKAIKKEFPNTPLLGCYFHFSKAIIKKYKELGLLKKKKFLKF